MSNFDIKNFTSEVLKRLLGGPEVQATQQGLADISNRFQNFTQTVPKVADQIRAGIAAKVAEIPKANLNFMTPQQHQEFNQKSQAAIQAPIQAIQNRFTALHGNFDQILKPRIQEFEQDFQNRIQTVNNRYIQPAVNYGRDVAAFAGIGTTPEGTRRRENFALKNPLPTQQQQMEQAMNFSPMGVQKVGAKVGQVLTARLAQEGESLLKNLSKEERLNHLLTYGQELINRGFSKAQVDLIGAKEAASILKSKLAPLDVFGKGKPVTIEDNFIQEGRAAFDEWVNTRRASQVEGAIQKSKFKVLDSEKFQGITNFQKGDTTGKYADVKKFFDSKFKELQDAGIEFGYKNDYLPQLWNNTEKEIEKAVGKTLGLKPSFSMQSVIKDYQAGIDAGLTPKYENLSDLAKWYEQRSNKALADKNFFDFLRKNNLIIPSDTAPANWVTLNVDRFPKFSVKTGEGVFSGTYKTEPELAKLINNYLDQPEGPLQTFAALATRVKNLGLSGGIPGTAINYHGAVNLFRRDLLAAKNPISTLFRDAYWIVNTKAAENYVTKNLEDAAFFVKHGLTITSEDWGVFVKELPKSKFGKVEGWVEKYFGDPTFKQFLPAIKLDFAKKTFADLIKVMPEKEAATKASEIANNLFGGINLDQIGRSKQTQAFLRSIILAPDWAETTIRTAKGMYKGLRHPTDPEFAVYRTVTRNMALFYIAENAINKVLSGHYMFENEGIANKFRIDTGTYESNGKKRYLGSWGTAQDMIRIPLQLGMGLYEGNIGSIVEPVVNRFSMPLSATSHLLTNQDYLHRPIYGKDQYGNDIPAKQQAGAVINELASGLGVPVQFRAFVDYVTSKSTGEEAISNALETPVKYTGGAYSDKQKAKVADMQAKGVSGADIAESLKLQSKVNKKKDDSNFWEAIFGKKEEETAEPGSLQAMGQTAEKRKEQEATIRQLFAHSTDTEVRKELSNMGVDYEAARLIYLQGTEIKDRAPFIKEALKGLSNTDFTKTALYLAENEILSTGVTAFWLDEGSITKEQQKMLNNLISYSKGTVDTINGNRPKAKAPYHMPVSSIGSVSIDSTTPTAFKTPTLPKRLFTPITYKKITARSMQRGSIYG